MSSYFDYYCGNTKKVSKSTNEIIIGTCNSMCPHEEVKLRIREHMIHVLEVVGSEKKLVKCYSRSAADATMAVPRFLRPYPILRNTVIYLLFEVTRRADVPTNVLYDFLNDRLRSVRQDMTIQRLPPEHCIMLLEPMVRFYVYYGYVLRNLPLKDYDPVLNKKHLLECIKWYLSCTDAVDRNFGIDSGLIECLAKLDLEDEKDRRLSCDRVLMESLYILCNLDDIHPLYRYITLSKELRRNPKLLMSYSIAIANHNGNYLRVCRLMGILHPLAYRAMFLHLPQIQRRALEVMSRAYNSSRLTMPVAALRKCLRFSTDSEAREICSHYGLSVDGQAVMFEKTTFNGEVELHSLQTPQCEEVLSIENLWIS